METGSKNLQCWCQESSEMSVNSNEERRKRIWMAIEESLLPDDLMAIMPPEEWKGLTMLVASLARSGACSTSEPGRIVADYDDQVEVVLYLESMLRKRIDWLGMLGITKPERNSSHKPDAHLMVMARRKTTTGGCDDWSREACVFARHEDALPVTDLAATFVMWADSGFPDIPVTLLMEISFLKGSDTYEEFLTEKRRLEREAEEEAEGRRRCRNREAERRHAAIELKRRLADADAEVSVMSWRELMAVHRAVPAAPLLHGLAEDLLIPGVLD